jgi:lysophospholipase L1-like esterase
LSRRRLAITLAAALLSPLAAELAFRVFVHRSPEEEGRRAALRERVLHGNSRWEGRAYTSYGLKPGSAGCNSLGFLGPEWTRERAPGVARVLCLGASTTQGGNDAGLEGSYPYLLEQGLEQATGAPFEVMNCGVALWTTAEILVSWFLLLQDYAPDVVILHEAVNDIEPRNAPGFVPDYRHWRVPFHEPSFGALERCLIRSSDLYADWVVANRSPTLFTMTTQRLPGHPVFNGKGRKLPAKTAQPFRRNAASIGASVELQGARMCVMTLPVRPPDAEEQPYTEFSRAGIEEHNQILRDLAAEHGWILIDAAALFPTYPGLDLKAEFRDLVHLSPQGNLAKAALAGAALREEWLGKEE